MIHVLVRKLIILQDDLNLLIHLRTDVTTQHTSNNGQNSKAQTRQRGHSQCMNVRLLQGSSTSGNRISRDTRDFSERLRTKWERLHEGDDGRCRKPDDPESRRDKLQRVRV